jgi:hypothetical protein
MEDNDANEIEVLKARIEKLETALAEQKKRIEELEGAVASIVGMTHGAAGCPAHDGARRLRRSPAQRPSLAIACAIAFASACVSLCGSADRAIPSTE